jgi:transposase
MRYELSDYEWTAIKPILPNKPRSVRGGSQKFIASRDRVV